MMYMGAEVHSVGRMSEPPTIDQPPRREFPEARYPMQELTGRIIGASFVVHGEFGFGFLESVYRRALAVELRHQGVPLGFRTSSSIAACTSGCIAPIWWWTRR